MEKDITEKELDGPVILFDGVCNLCNGSVNFIIKRDPRAVFSFAPLQSEISKSILAAFGIPTDRLDTLILIDQGKCYTRSEAALRVAHRLNGLWPLFYGFIIVPGIIRDWVYKFISAHRYKWFGKTETCMVPGPGVKERFLG